MQKSLISHKKSNEWLEFISRLGLVSMAQARAVFLSGDYTQLDDVGQKALYTAGRGKTLSLEGNLIGSKMTLDEAQLLAEMRNAEKGYLVKDEILAYVNYERAVFFEKYGESFNGMSLYRSAKRLAESKTLDSIIDYQLSFIDLQNGTGGSVAEAEAWIRYFSENDMQIMQLLAMRRLATHFRDRKQFDRAEKLLMQALDYSTAYDFPFIVEQIKNSYGYLYLRRGETLAAREIFLALINGLESNYLKATVMENLTLTHYTQEEHDKAADYLSKAIDHCKKYDILSLVPEQSLFLGDLYRDKLGNPELATYYYDIGSQAALRMAEYGFSLQGDRLKVIQNFHNRSRVGYSIPETLRAPQEPFAFAKGKTWKEINDIFQYLLIQYHLESNSIGTDLPEKLALKASTYYAIKRRLVQHGYAFKKTSTPSHLAITTQETVAFRLYISGLRDLTWAEANQRFEAEVVEYLFKLAGYQKTRLADELDISYPTVLQKTKSLTSS